MAKAGRPPLIGFSKFDLGFKLTGSKYRFTQMPVASRLRGDRAACVLYFVLWWNIEMMGGVNVGMRSSVKR